MRCGGCAGLGAHVRWCPTVVGPAASKVGQAADTAEGLGDTIGSASPAAANACWGLAATLRDDADRIARDWQAQQRTGAGA